MNRCAGCMTDLRRGMKYYEVRGFRWCVKCSQQEFAKLAAKQAARAHALSEKEN